MRILFILLVSLATVLAAADKIKIDDPKLITSSCISNLDTRFKWVGCKGLKKKKLIKCVCKDDAFIESAVHCIDKLAENATVPGAQKHAYKVLLASCKANKKLNATYLGALSARASDIPLGKEKSLAKTAVALPDKYYYYGYVAEYNKDVEVSRAYRYVGNILSYWAGIFIFRTIYYIITLIFPTVPLLFNWLPFKLTRKLLILPALFGYSHSTHPTLFRYFTFSIPTRAASLIVFGYFVVNWVLIFAYMPIYNAPNQYYQDSYAWQVAKVVADRSGYAVLYQLPLLFLFGGRNNFLLVLTGWSLDTFNVFHKWVGRVVFFDLVSHAGAYSYVRLAGGRYKEMWTTAYWCWGVVGIVFCALAITVGIHWFRRLGYETFLILHIIGAIFFIVGGYYHIDLLDDDLEFFYAIWAVWIFDRFVRLVRILVSNPFAKATIKTVDQFTLEYTVSYSGIWKPYAASYVFIHMVQPAFFWESHPFSLMESVTEGEEGQLKLYCRVKDGMTRNTMAKCVQNGGEITSRVWLDGPYGSGYSFTAFPENVFFSGGVGITGSFSCIQNILKKGYGSQHKITLHWIVATESCLDWFKSELDYMVGAGVEVNLYIWTGAPAPLVREKTPDSAEKKTVMSSSSGVNCIYSPMDVRALVKSHMLNSSSPLSIFVCGPSGINDGARRAVADYLIEAPNYVEYYEESFSW